MDIDADKNTKLDFLTKRDLERKVDIQKRKYDKDLGGAENEKIEFFEEMFSKNVDEIESALNSVANIPSTDLPDYFNNISKQILMLQKFVAASNIFLRSYHIQKCQNIIQSLSSKAKELEEKWLPKKKFGFKNKKKCISNKTHLIGYGQDEIDSNIDRNKGKIETCDFVNKEGETIIMYQDDVFKKDISVQKLQKCLVKIHGSPSTLHISCLKNSHVFCGPVSTSVFAENCENSVLVIACQQLRLHSSRNMTIYLHVTSRAIMEDCSNIRLAPYNWKYEGIEKDFEISGLNIAHNNWKCVDDFNWLNIQKPSPNWSALDESERILDWNKTILQYKEY